VVLTDHFAGARGSTHKISQINFKFIIIARSEDIKRETIIFTINSSEAEGNNPDNGGIHKTFRDHPAWFTGTRYNV